MNKIVKGQSLPQVIVDNKGEVLLDDGRTYYEQWDSQALKGKVRCVHHMAGRSSAKDINEALMETLKKAGLPQSDYQTTTIVNLKDAIFGTGSLVSMMVEGGKKEFPWSSVVIDAKGAVQAAWGLEKESSAVAILDRSGQVLFFKDGKLTAEEVSSAVAMISEQLAEAGVPA